MKNTNIWKTALAMGALTTIGSGAKAQYAPYGQPYGNSNYGQNYGNSTYIGGGISFLSGSPYGGGTYGPFASNSYGPIVIGGGNYGYGNSPAYFPYGYSPFYDVNSGGNYGNNPNSAIGAPDVYYNSGDYSDNPYDSNNPDGNYYAGNGNNGNGSAPNTPAPYYNAPNGAAPARTAAARVLARTTDTLDAKRLPNSRFYIGWRGDNNTVNKITFAMLDMSKHAIMTRTVTQAPGEYTFPITSRMAYYQVVVEYLNGTTNTVTSPL